MVCFEKSTMHGRASRLQPFSDLARPPNLPPFSTRSNHRLCLGPPCLVFSAVAFYPIILISCSFDVQLRRNAFFGFKDSTKAILADEVESCREPSDT